MASRNHERERFFIAFKKQPLSPEKTGQLNKKNNSSEWAREAREDSFLGHRILPSRMEIRCWLGEKRVPTFELKDSDAGKVQQLSVCTETESSLASGRGAMYGSGSDWRSSTGNTWLSCWVGRRVIINANTHVSHRTKLINKSDSSVLRGAETYLCFLTWSRSNQGLGPILGNGSGVLRGTAVPILSSHLLEATALSGNYCWGDKYGDKPILSCKMYEVSGHWQWCTWPGNKWREGGSAAHKPPFSCRPCLVSSQIVITEISRGVDSRNLWVLFACLGCEC